MGFAEDLRNSHQPETDEEKARKNYDERAKRVRELIYSITRSGINITTAMAKHGHYKTLNNGTRKIKFYIGVGLGMNFEFCRQGMGVFRGIKEDLYKVTIDLTNEELLDTFNGVKNNLEKKGIIVKGPFIASNYVYSMLLGYGPPIMTSCSIIDSSQKIRWKQWNVKHLSSIVENPYQTWSDSHYYRGSIINTGNYRAADAADYIPVFELEIIY